MTAAWIAGISAPTSPDRIAAITITSTVSGLTSLGILSNRNYSFDHTWKPPPQAGCRFALFQTRREARDQIGPLDDEYFMYSEELDWCRRAKSAGWKVVYYPEAQIIHHRGKSSQQVKVFQIVRFNRSKIHYFRKHHSAFVATALRAFLLFNYGYQLLLETTKWVIGHRRPLRRQRMHAYCQVLKSGL